MRKVLRALALLVILASGITWAATGANCGWTKTSVPIRTLDTVTGIEGITYQKKFLPGVDFLGAAGGIAIVLAAASFLFRKPQSKPQPTTEGT